MPISQGSQTRPIWTRIDYWKLIKCTVIYIFNLCIYNILTFGLSFIINNISGCNRHCLNAHKKIKSPVFDFKRGIQFQADPILKPHNMLMGLNGLFDTIIFAVLIESRWILRAQRALEELILNCRQRKCANVYWRCNILETNIFHTTSILVHNLNGAWIVVGWVWKSHNFQVLTKQMATREIIPFEKRPKGRVRSFTII